MSSEQNSQNEGNKKQNQKKRARRTRKDEDGRDYVCSCGKSYLSYPALYTHVKTKHDGKTSIMANQGPQKNNNEQQDKPVMKQDLQQLKMFLNTKYYPQRFRATALNQLAEFFSTEQRQYIIPSLFYWQNEQKNQKTNPSSGQNNRISAKQVFAKFIYDMNKRTNKNCIKFLVKLIMQIHRGVCIQKKNEKYCQQCTASLVPSVFNQIILNGHIAIDKNSPEKIMQDSDAICKVMAFFSNWMFNQKYTNYSIKYKQ